MKVAILVAFAVLAQDKAKGLNPGQLIAKSGETMKRIKTYHVSIEIKARAGNMNYTGTCKGDASACQGGNTEIYAKGSNYLVKNADGKFVPPSQLDVQTEEGRAGAAFRNPALMLAEILTCTNPTPSEDAQVGDVDCKVVNVSLPKAQKEIMIKEFISKINLPIPNAQQFVDVDKSTATYTVYVSKADLRVVKYVFDLNLEAKKGIPMGDRLGDLGTQTTVENSKFDEELEWKIPKDVQSKLGLK